MQVKPLDGSDRAVELRPHGVVVGKPPLLKSVEAQGEAGLLSVVAGVGKLPAGVDVAEVVVLHKIKGEGDGRRHDDLDASAGSAAGNPPRTRLRRVNDNDPASLDRGQRCVPMPAAIRICLSDCSAVRPSQNQVGNILLTLDLIPDCECQGLNAGVDEELPLSGFLFGGARARDGLCLVPQVLGMAARPSAGDPHHLIDGSAGEPSKVGTHGISDKAGTKR